ncbi:MAG: hypothetical protein JXR96_02200 [Deltaproteobacteria bacterium]|nr:hypothetical protein [Deltaproteobacteria bacterium]
MKPRGPVLAGMLMLLPLACTGTVGSTSDAGEGLDAREADGADGQAADDGTAGGDRARDAGDAGSDGADGGPDGADAGGDTGSGCATLRVETVDSASVIPAPSGPMPAPGVPFVIPETGVSIARISDSVDAGGFASFYTNGYSRFSPANLSGEYVTAFASNGGAAIYRLADRAVVATLQVGEPNELHWDSSGAAGTDTHLYYRTGAQLRRRDVLLGEGSDELVHDFTAEYPGAGAAINGVEGAPSADMRYWAFQICDSMDGSGQCRGIRDVIVYDAQADAIAGRLRDRHPSFPTPNFVDMAPSGSAIVVGTCAGNDPPFNGPYAWTRDFQRPVRLSTNCSHSGWAWSAEGKQLYVSQDPCGANNDERTFTCDYIMAVDVDDAEGWEERVPILYCGDIGWGVGFHLGRIYFPEVAGWFFISTYTERQGWAADQLFFVEIEPADRDPRLFRVAPTLNSYEGYWSEAFASLDFQAQHVYWGANWSGQEALQLYQATLCTGWWEALAGR